MVSEAVVLQLYLHTRTNVKNVSFRLKVRVTYVWKQPDENSISLLISAYIYSKGFRFLVNIIAFAILNLAAISIVDFPI